MGVAPGPPLTPAASGAEASRIGARFRGPLQTAPGPDEPRAYPGRSPRTLRGRRCGLGLRSQGSEDAMDDAGAVKTQGMVRLPAREIPSPANISDAARAI